MTPSRPWVRDSPCLIPLVVAVMHPIEAHGIVFFNRTYMCMKGGLDSATDYLVMPRQSAMEHLTSPTSGASCVVSGLQSERIPTTPSTRQRVDVTEAAGMMMVQTVMELGSDSEEELLPTRLVMEEVRHSVDPSHGGDETTAQALAASFVQLGSQMGECSPDLILYHHMAEIMQPYVARQPLVYDIPSVAWREWYDGILVAAMEVTSRLRAARRDARMTNMNNAVHAEPPNGNDRIADVAPWPANLEEDEGMVALELHAVSFCGPAVGVQALLLPHGGKRPMRDYEDGDKSALVITRVETRRSRSRAKDILNGVVKLPVPLRGRVS